MQGINIIVYGTGEMAKEFSHQVFTFNQIFSKEINIIAYTETKFRGGILTE